MRQQKSRREWRCVRRHRLCFGCLVEIDRRVVAGRSAFRINKRCRSSAALLRKRMTGMGKNIVHKFQLRHTEGHGILAKGGNFIAAKYAAKSTVRTPCQA